MLDLTGKVAVITGGGRGIGRGIGVALARAGADVAIADYFRDRAEDAAREIRLLGRRAAAIEADVRDKAAMERMIQTTVAELGGVHIAVANAGTGRGGGVLHMTEEDWDLQNDILAKGVFLTVQAAARQMVKQGMGGRVITIASLAAERPAPMMFGYCGAKAAVRMMSRCWAQELSPFGITVNSIGPGLIDTDLAAALVGETEEARRASAARIPSGRHGQPSDIGNLSVWLASDEAEYVTGTYNLIDGGLADASGFNLESPYGQLVGYIRSARAKGKDGGELLAEIDAMVAAGSAQADEVRAARGIV